MSSAVTGKGVPVKVPNRSIRLSVLRLVRMAVAFVVVAGSLGLATVTATAQDGGSSCPSEGAAAYSDVPESSFAYDDSRCLRELGISDAGDTYRPGDDMTRSEMAAFMANAYKTLTGMVAPIEEHAFTDIADDPNADDIARISPNGLAITTGTTDTTYSPDDPVIRAHMALFLTRLYERVAGSEAPAADTEFTDIAERNDEQQAAIGQLFGLGVTTGTSATTYSPTDNVTREQMASFVARMYRVLDSIAVAPGAPTGVAVAVSGNIGDALDVSWTAPEDSGSSDVTGYVVQWKSGDDDYSDDNQSSVDDTSSNFDGLTKGTAYTFRVAAVSDDGQSDWSDEASGNPGTVPGTVGDFQVVVGAASGSLVLSWTAPADNGGTPITGYVVSWASGRDAPASAVIDDGSATSYTISDLKTGVAYRVHIQAMNGAGSGAITAPAEAGERVVTTSTSVGTGSVRVVLPNSITDLAGFRAGGKFASLVWPTPALGARQYIDDYEIQRKCGTQAWPAAHVDDGPRTDTQDHTTFAVQVLANTGTLGVLGGAGGAEAGALANGVVCNFRVRANTWIDLGNDLTGIGVQQADSTLAGYERTLVGAWVLGSGTPLGVPGAPTVVDGDSDDTNVTLEVAHQSLRVSWTPATVDHDGNPLTPNVVNNGGSPITGYKISWESPATVPIGDVTVPATSRIHTITGLTNGLIYTVQIQAVNARGASAKTAAINGTPLAVRGAPTNVRISQPPGPTPLSLADNRGNALIVSWSAPAANATGVPTGYMVERRTSAVPARGLPAGDWGAADPGHTGTGTAYGDPIEVAERGTSFDYRVRTVNRAGSGLWSEFASGTAAALPDQVALDTIEVISGPGSLTLTWNNPAGNGNGPTHYNVRYARNVQGVEAWSSTRRVNRSALPTTVISGLSAGPHTVGITAVNDVGSSDETQTSGGHSPAFALAAPSSVTAVPSALMNTTGSRLDVTWSGVSNALGYTVEYINTALNPVTAANWLAVDPLRAAGVACDPAVEGAVDLDPGCRTVGGTNHFDPRVRKATVIGLPDISDHTTGALTYVVRVRAVTQNQQGGQGVGPALPGVPGFAVPVKAVNTPDSAPLTPAVAQVPKTTTLRVEWSPPLDHLVEGVTGYKVTWYPTLSTVVGNRGSANVGADAGSYNITGLNAFFQEITVVVAAVNKIGTGTATAGQTVTLLPPS